MTEMESGGWPATSDIGKQEELEGKDPSVVEFDNVCQGSDRYYVGPKGKCGPVNCRYTCDSISIASGTMEDCRWVEKLVIPRAFGSRSERLGAQGFPSQRPEKCPGFSQSGKHRHPLSLNSSLPVQLEPSFDNR